LPVCLSEVEKDNNDSKKISFVDIKIWYYVNREFAENLPDRYRIPILQELDIMDKMVKGTMALEQGCNELKGKSFFNVCSIHSINIIQFNCYPNPLTSNNLTIQLKCTKALDLNFRIHDYNGKCVLPFNDSFRVREGENTLTLNDISLNTGVYLLHASSTDGDEVVIKLIINR
jgi:hypothetical protein